MINFTLPLLMKQCLENFLFWTLWIFSIFWTVDTHCFLSACMGWLRLWCKLLKIVVAVFIQSLNELLILCCFIVEAYLAKLFRRFSTVRFWRMKLVRKVPMSLHKSERIMSKIIIEIFPDCIVYITNISLSPSIFISLH